MRNPEFRSCPYVKEHVVKVTRFQKHLINCRKQHPEVELVRCPFNSIHLVRLEDRERHLREECMDSNELPYFLRALEIAQANEGKLRADAVRRLIEDNEKWEEKEQAVPAEVKTTAEDSVQGTEAPPEEVKDFSEKRFDALVDKVSKWLSGANYLCEDAPNDSEPVVVNHESE